MRSDSLGFLSALFFSCLVGCSADAPNATTSQGGSAGAGSISAGSSGADVAGGTGGASGTGDVEGAGNAGTSTGGSTSAPSDAGEVSEAASSDASRDAASDASANVPWTGTWAVSPQSAGTTFAQKTLRQIVHTSIGGMRARIQISNAFGNQPLAVRDVHIAQRSTGSSIVASSDRPVTFGGSNAVTIANGSLAASDPIGFVVSPLSDVAISMYLASTTGPSTNHGQGTQTNYMAPGDVAGDANLTNAQSTGSYWFLTNLDVQNPAALGAVVTLGASITDGVASPDNANHRWPNYLAEQLAKAGVAVGVLNQGISGNRLLVDGAGQSALNRFDRDVLAQPNVKWVIFSDDPINDLGDGAPSADQLTAAMSQLVARAHQKNIKFFCSTLTPFEGANYWTAQGETGREAVDAFIRGATSGCDAIVDQDTATHDPAHPTKYLPAFDAGDHLHPNEMGMQAIANAVDLLDFSKPR
jgi:lysophospholipase L1-like esterase